MAKTEKRRYGSFWICPNCEGSPEFEHKDMMEHLRTVHNIDVATTKGTRSMLMHVDGTDFYMWQYEWEIGGLKFHQTTCNKRSKGDQMNWR